MAIKGLKTVEADIFGDPTLQETEAVEVEVVGTPVAEVVDTTLVQVLARIPLHKYAFLDVTLTGPNAIEDAIALTNQYSSEADGVGADSPKAERVDAVLYGGELVLDLLPSKFANIFKDAIVYDNRETKSKPTQPDFKAQKGDKSLSAWIQEDGTLSWSKEIYQKR